jgi:hypothetical protein
MSIAALAQAAASSFLVSFMTSPFLVECFLLEAMEAL